MDYRVDIEDVKFQLFEWLDTEDLLAAERFDDWDRDNVEMVLDEALTLAQEQLAPINEEGDRTGVVWDHGQVQVPKAFGKAYELYRDGGWPGATASPELGGLGLPEVVGSVVLELFCGANLGFSLVSTLTRGVGRLIESFGSDEMKALFCEKLYSGEWTGTMCLTEPQAGSDLGATSSRAEPHGSEGRYLLRGEKIFITSGEHDLTENIVHAVLARTPGAPSGTRGLSLFIVSKFHLHADGSLGERNDVQCSGVEHKMGIHASPTCSMVFGQNDACEGFLLGEEHGGMAEMFQMMNDARIEVGIQGLAVGGAAQQAALAYARERRQMKHWQERRPDEKQVRIVEHPDVRRMLLGGAARIQAMRALLYQTSLYLDRMHDSEGEERERYQSYVDLLTPVCKAWSSDGGFEVASTSLLVYGGYGYTTDYPAEQYVRDARIASIYEGTNGIQALDFVGRKLGVRGGAAVNEMLARAATAAQSDDAELSGAAAQLESAVGELRGVLEGVHRSEDKRLLLTLNATALLDMFGTVLGGTFLLEQAAVARGKLEALATERGATGAESRRQLVEESPEAAYYHNKVQAAIFFAYRNLPTVAGHAVAIRAGERAAIDVMM